MASVLVKRYQLYLVLLGVFIIISVFGGLKTHKEIMQYTVYEDQITDLINKGKGEEAALILPPHFPWASGVLSDDREIFDGKLKELRSKRNGQFALSGMVAATEIVLLILWLRERRKAG